MPLHRASRVLYRAVLRLYPATFRERFGDDLDRDFTDLIAQRGAMPRGAVSRPISPGR
jgi:hypothetical protein